MKNWVDWTVFERLNTVRGNYGRILVDLIQYRSLSETHKSVEWAIIESSFDCTSASEHWFSIHCISVFRYSSRVFRMKFVLVLLLSSSVAALNKDEFIPVFQNLVSGYLGANTGKVMISLKNCLFGEKDVNDNSSRLWTWSQLMHAHLSQWMISLLVCLYRHFRYSWL